MTLSLRNGIWHWKKMVNGELYARTTKTGDKKLAEQIAAVWEGELIQQVLVLGHKPILVHDALNGLPREAHRSRNLRNREHTELDCPKHLPASRRKAEVCAELISRRLEPSIQSKKREDQLSNSIAPRTTAHHEVPSCIWPLGAR